MTAAFSLTRTRCRARPTAREPAEGQVPSPMALGKVHVPEHFGDADSERTLPVTMSTTMTKLPPADQRLLLKKQSWLKKHELVIPKGFRRHASTVDSILLFARKRVARRSVCRLGPSLDVLTLHRRDCGATRVVENTLSPNPGSAVKAECVAWDAIQGIALPQIVAAQADHQPIDRCQFPFVQVADGPPVKNASMIRIGYPGSEDLEASQSGTSANSDVLRVSTGLFRGYAEQDLQDNSEIGALMHDCWT